MGHRIISSFKVRAFKHAVCRAVLLSVCHIIEIQPRYFRDITFIGIRFRIFIYWRDAYSEIAGLRHIEGERRKRRTDLEYRAFQLNIPFDSGQVIDYYFYTARRRFLRKSNAEKIALLFKRGVKADEIVFVLLRTVAVLGFIKGDCFLYKFSVGRKGIAHFSATEAQKFIPADLRSGSDLIEKIFRHGNRICLLRDGFRRTDGTYFPIGIYSIYQFSADSRRAAAEVICKERFSPFGNGA